LDVTTQLLTLHFSEIVDVTTTTFTAITLQKSGGVGGSVDDSVTLTDGATVGTNDALTVVVNITNADMDLLKIRKIGIDTASTYLTVTDNLIQDMNSLDVIPVVDYVSALQVSAFTTDQTRPVLLKCALDMNDALLTLSFSETVDASTLAVNKMQVQQALDNVTGESYALQSPSGVAARAATDSATVVVDVSLADMNAIKFAVERGLALGQTSVFCSAGSGLVKDVFGLDSEAVSSTTALPASGYVNDITPPKLLSFDLNMNEYITEDFVAVASASITLRFDETVDFESYNASALFLQSVANSSLGGSQSVQLSGFFENVTRTDGTTIVFTFIRDDTDSLKLFESLAVSSGSTFVSMLSTFVSDVYGNPIQAISADTAKQVSVSGFTPDTTAPQLLRFTIDMDMGTIRFVFDETVKGLSINPDELTIRDTSDPALQTVNYTLTGGIGENAVGWTKAVSQRTFPHSDSTDILLTFTKADLDEIKRLSLCTRAALGNDCFIVHTEFFVHDMSDNDVTRCT